MSWSNSPGTVTRSGTAVLDFGLTPSPEASVSVTGQTGITTASRVRVWFGGNTMSDNDATEHLMAGVLTKLTPSQPVADDGFTIYADNIGGLATGKFRLQWLWSA